ncbi:hypothetical protein B0H14DRAFT_2651586 [Mycena olivaceomarginata]|nr:hypothetical protein B0H14DRAFT_2651586 [Mycena olivaceomarginata]
MVLEAIIDSMDYKILSWVLIVYSEVDRKNGVVDTRRTWNSIQGFLYAVGLTISTKQLSWECKMVLEAIIDNLDYKILSWVLIVYSEVDRKNGVVDTRRTWNSIQGFLYAVGLTISTKQLSWECKMVLEAIIDNLDYKILSWVLIVYSEVDRKNGVVDTRRTRNSIKGFLYAVGLEISSACKRE